MVDLQFRFPTRMQMRAILQMMGRYFCYAVVALTFDIIGLSLHTYVVADVVPATSIVSSQGPEWVQVSRLWKEISINSASKQKSFLRRVESIEKLGSDYGIEQQLVSRSTFLFWLFFLNIFSSTYFVIRYFRELGYIETVSKYIVMSILPTLLLTTVLYRTDPREVFSAWASQHHIAPAIFRRP